MYKDHKDDSHSPISREKDLMSLLGIQ